MSNNLPPGVTEQMLPGNRPEDLEYEKAIDELREELGDIIAHYRTQYPLLRDDDIQDVLLVLLPRRSDVIPKWQIENAVQKHIERELEWANECTRSRSYDKDLFLKTQKTIRSRLLGIKLLVQRLLYNSENIEELIEDAHTKVSNMAWQGPAA